MGKLYLAEDLRTGTRVTVRMLGSEFLGDEQFAGALERHALRLAALCITSDSVAKLCEFDRADQTGLLIAMEHLDGKTLTDVIQAEGALPVGRALHLAIQIARGLEAAHALGLVHGGLTPDNIVVTDTDEAKLMDFGLAELRSAAATKRPGSAAAIGPEYLAPEQLEGGEITEKTDIYAFGTVLYQMLCGAAPFSSTFGFSVALAKRLYEAPALPGKSRRSVPRSVERIIRITLTRQPDRRPGIVAVIEDLESEQHRLHESRVRRHARVKLHALVEAVADVAITVRQSSLKWKLGFASCGLLIVLSVATVWIPLSRTILAPPPPRQRPDAASEGAGRTRPPNPPAVEPTVSTPETPTANRLPKTPAAKPLPETTVSPKKAAPLASTQKQGTPRQSASPAAAPRDNRTAEPASSDPSDPAGVIDWLLKESARDR
jgi:serine/threonine protein kinase